MVRDGVAVIKRSPGRSTRLLNSVFEWYPFNHLAQLPKSAQSAPSFLGALSGLYYCAQHAVAVQTFFGSLGALGQSLTPETALGTCSNKEANLQVVMPCFYSIGLMILRAIDQ